MLDDGVPSEPQAGFPANYLVNAGLNRAFDNFWANAPAAGRGLQDALRRGVAARGDEVRSRSPVRRRLRPAQRAVARQSAFQSDNCFNTAGCATFDGTTLAPFNERVIDAIRGVDPETLIFYEPLVTFDFGADSKLPDTGDPAAGFSFHNYCLPGSLGGPGSGPACEPLEDLVFANADKQSTETGDVPFLTEFGATDDLETIGRIVRLADAHMTSWQYWHYCACDDPTTSGPGVQALVIDARHAAARRQRQPRPSCSTLARPYPRAVAGTPAQLRLRPGDAPVRARLLDAGAPARRARPAPRPRGEDRGLPAQGPVPERLPGPGQRRRGSSRSPAPGC